MASKYSSELVSTLKQDYLSGITFKQLALNYNIPFSSVAVLVRNTGIQIRPKSSIKYQVKDDVFETIDSEEKAYWLGFITADGCLIKRGKCKLFTICLSKVDETHLNKLIQFLKFEGPISTYKNQVSISITSSKLFDSLVNKGVTPLKTFVVKPYLDLSSELSNHYWRGLVDGDGYIQKPSRTKRRFNFQIELYGNEYICEGFTISKVSKKKNSPAYSARKPKA